MIRRVRRRYGPVAAAVVCVLLVLAQLLRGPTAPSDHLAPGPYRVERVVDGDTLVVEGRVRVRLLGVDTPETKHPRRGVEFYGPEATAMTRRLVEGRPVRLEFDRERTDRYGRVLAYVYVDGTMLNEALLRGGYGRARLEFPYSDAMKRRFRQAEEAARREGLGIWSRPVEAAP